MEVEEKKPRITIKGLGEVTEADWRGIIAVITVGGTMTIAAICSLTGRIDALTTVMAIFGPLDVMIVRDYFESKKE